MNEKKFHYFISYAHENGFGNAETRRSKPIASIKKTHSISKEFERDLGVRKVVVLNFQLFEPVVEDLK